MRALKPALHLYFVPNGTVVDSVTVSRTVKPDVDPATNWTNFPVGIIRSAEEEIEETEHVVRRPQPGASVADDVILLRSDRRLSGVIEEMSALTMQLAKGSGAIDMGADPAGLYVPLAKRQPVIGWAKFQAYDERNQLLWAEDVYGRLRINGALSGYGTEGDDVQTFPFEFMQLYSTLTTGQLSNIAAWPLA